MQNDAVQEVGDPEAVAVDEPEPIAVDELEPIAVEEPELIEVKKPEPIEVKRPEPILVDRKITDEYGTIGETAGNCVTFLTDGSQILHYKAFHWFIIVSPRI